MEATCHMERPYRLDPCPADERVGTTYVQNSDDGAKGGKEGEVQGEDGITRQRCGGGHRIIKKKIGGG